MPFVQRLLIHVPNGLLEAAMVLAGVLLVLVGSFVIRGLAPTLRAKVANDVAGSIFTTLGVIYAVLLAFMVIVTWQNFDLSSRNVVKEANYIADLFRDSTPFAPEFRATLKSDLKAYVEAIVGDEWTLQGQGKRSPLVQEAQARLWVLYAGYAPRSETEKAFFAESVSKMNATCEMRRERLLDASSGIHPALYFVLFAGGLITVLSSLLFKTEFTATHVLMSSLMAALIALTLFTIMAMDFPFTGSISISPHVFRSVLGTLLAS